MLFNSFNSSQAAIQQMILLQNSPFLLQNYNSQQLLIPNQVNGNNSQNTQMASIVPIDQSLFWPNPALSLEYLQNHILSYNLEKFNSQQSTASEANLSSQIQQSTVLPLLRKPIQKSSITKSSSGSSFSRRAKFSSQTSCRVQPIQLIQTIGQSSPQSDTTPRLLDSFDNLHKNNISASSDDTTSSSPLSSWSSKNKILPKKFLQNQSVSKHQEQPSISLLQLSDKTGNQLAAHECASSELVKDVFLNFTKNSSNQSNQNSSDKSSISISHGSTLNLNLQVKSQQFLQQFDFSDVRQNQCKNKKSTRERKPNSSYVKNSQYHNLNKLFMYNILNMFRADALENINIPADLSKELVKIIYKLKISSRRDYQNPQRGFFDYFSHGHYKVLFLQINPTNISSIRENEVELDLHKQCYNIDLSKEISEANLNYLNTIKEINFKIFTTNIREDQLFDDGTSSKQNIRRKYTLKVINGIKKLAKGQPIKRF